MTELKTTIEVIVGRRCSITTKNESDIINCQFSRVNGCCSAINLQIAVDTNQTSSGTIITRIKIELTSRSKEVALNS